MEKKDYFDVGVAGAAGASGVVCSVLVGTKGVTGWVAGALVVMVSVTERVLA